MKKSTIVIIFLSVSLMVSLYHITVHDHLFCPSKYPFISTDLNCDADPQPKTVSLKHKTEEVVESLVSSKKIKRASVFYRDLGNRQWFGVNENDPFEPGSLLKLPLAIAYYKLAEVDPNLLGLKHKYILPKDNKAYDTQLTKPDNLLENNVDYTVQNLIERMIKYSDNAPVEILVGV